MADPLDPAALRKVAERALDRWADETEAGILARGCIALLDREDAAQKAVEGSKGLTLAAHRECDRLTKERDEAQRQQANTDACGTCTTCLLREIEAEKSKTEEALCRAAAAEGRIQGLAGLFGCPAGNLRTEITEQFTTLTKERDHYRSGVAHFLARVRGEGRPCGGCGGCTTKHWHPNICVGSRWHAPKEVQEAVEQKRDLPQRSSRQDLLTLAAVAKVLGWTYEPEEVLPAIAALKNVPFKPPERCAWLPGLRQALCADALLLADGEDLEGFDAHVLACAGPVPGQVETPEQG